jgi:hypothetical protein
LQHFLHKPVGFLFLFCALNTAIVVSSNMGYCSTLQYWNRFRVNRRKTIGIYLFWPYP